MLLQETEVGFFLKFLLVHLIILAKSWQNLTFFGQFFKKIPNHDQLISLEFPPKVVLFPPEVGLNQLIFQNFQGFTRFVAKSFENWTWICSKCQIFCAPIKFSKKFKVLLRFYVVIFFQIFQGFTLLFWQKVGGILLGLGKTFFSDKKT